MKKKKKSFKNYFYSLLIIVGSILLILYILSWYNIKKEEKIMNSYLISSKTIESKIDSLNDLEQALNEAPLSYFVLISYTKDEDIYKFEKSIKRLIDKYKLNDLFYYVDSTNNINNNEYIDKLNKIFKTKEIKNIPTLIYIEEGKTKEVLNNVTSDTFKSLLEANGFEIVK